MRKVGVKYIHLVIESKNNVIHSGRNKRTLKKTWSRCQEIYFEDKSKRKKIASLVIKIIY